MKTVWLLYILISFNGDPKLEIRKYDTEGECEQEKIRITQEVKEVYAVENTQLHCIRILER
tara:strand:- start:4338 stop:4520 length:183 start_codon:yes stop_codon:yes gene_type:complete